MVFQHGNVPVTIVSLSLALGIGAWVCLVHKVLFCLNSLVLAIVIWRRTGKGSFCRYCRRDRATVGSAIISWVIHTNDPSGIAAGCQSLFTLVC